MDLEAMQGLGQEVELGGLVLGVIAGKGSSKA